MTIDELLDQLNAFKTHLDNGGNTPIRIAILESDFMNNKSLIISSDKLKVSVNQCNNSTDALYIISDGISQDMLPCKNNKNEYIIV